MKWRYFILVSMIMGALACPAFAQESSVFLALMPVQSAYVKGDVAKFEAMNWTREGTQSGIRLLTVDAKMMKDVTVSFEGSGMGRDADYSGHMLLTKENVGYIKLSYDSFRKYYENKGGYYPVFKSPGYDLHTLPADLNMDIGHVAVEIGKGSASDPDYSFAYERNTKQGSKDSTTWGYVKDYTMGANTTIDRRKIAPVFYNKDETIDTLTVKGKAEIAGFAVKGEQKYIYSNDNSLRQEKIYGSTSKATDNKAINQSENPKSQEFSTIVKAERWTLNDKNYISFAYRFGHLRNSMMMSDKDLLPSSRDIYPTGTFRDGQAQNIQDTHTFTGQLLSNLTDRLAFISSFKGELRSIHSFSETYTLADNQVAGWQTEAINDNKVSTGGESFSLRYSGLARTALYADLAFKQEHNWRAFSQSVTSAGGTPFGQEVVNSAPEGLGTIGARIFPIDKVSLTTEVKHGQKNDKRHLVSGDELEFITKLNTGSDAVSERIAWKPLKWLEGSVKVKAYSNIYHVTTANLDETKMPSTGKDFVYDITYMPTDALMFNASYSIKYQKVGGVGSNVHYAPSVSSGPANPVIFSAPPPATSNVYTYALSSSYAPTEKLSIFNTLEYSQAKNETNANSRNYQTTGPMLLGIAAAWYNIDTGVNWAPRKNLTIEPHYTYSSYRSADGVYMNNYNAHIIWLDVGVKW